MNEKLGTLYLVSTPIGNMQDITSRAVDVLRQVDFVICEDSRRSGLLLKHLNIKKPFRLCHEHTPKEQLDRIIGDIKKGGRGFRTLRVLMAKRARAARRAARKQRSRG